MHTEDNLTADEKIALREVRDSIRSLVGDRLRAVVLFGSKARGDFDDESDLDIAVLVEGLERTLKRKIIDVIAHIELKHGTPMSALVVSWEEFCSLRKQERRIAMDIEREGISL